MAYRVGRLYNDYIERTVCNKSTEGRWEQSLNMSAFAKQKWGNIKGEVSYDSMLDDSSPYAFNFSAGMNIRLVKGLSFNLNGNYNITRNQINIA